MLLATDRFAETAKRELKAAGMPDIPVVTVPHVFRPETPATGEEYARALADRCLQELTRGTV